MGHNYSLWNYGTGYPEGVLCCTEKSNTFN